MSAVEHNAFEQTDSFGIKDGFFVAAALTGYDEAMGNNDDPKYGELIFNNFGWGNEEANTLANAQLEAHPCSDEELGLVKGPNTLFYPTWESSVNELKAYKQNFKCMQNSNPVMWGDYNSQKA